MKKLQPFWLALVLLTTLPVGRLIQSPVTPEEQGKSVACYPLVGVLIGILLAVLGMVFAHVPSPLAAMLLLAGWVVITGALHLDGLADCSDALAAGHAGPGRILSVMKDPSCGPVAVTVLVLVLLLKLAALIVVGTTAVGLLLATPILARAVAATFMLTTNYRRSRGMATEHSHHLPKRVTLAITAVLTLACLFVLPVGVWFLLVLAAAAYALVWRALWQSRIGGYTGDTVGGLIESVEVVLLIVGALVL